MKQIKLPIQIVTIFIIIMTIGIKGFALNNNDQLNAAIQQNEFNFKLNMQNYFF